MDTIHQPVGCIYYVNHNHVGPIDGFDLVCDRARDLGFDTILLSPIFQGAPAGDLFLAGDHAWSDPTLGDGLPVVAAFKVLADACGARGLKLYSDLRLDSFAADHPLAHAHPDAFTSEQSAAAALDPRQPYPQADAVMARLNDDASAEVIAKWAGEQIGAWAAAGVQGFRILHTDAAPPAFWRALIKAAKAAHSELAFIAETQGQPRLSSLALGGCGFDALTSSLNWWDGQSRWFVEEYEALRTIAPLIAEVDGPLGQGQAPGAPPHLAHHQRLTLAAATGAAILAPMGFESATADLRDEIRAANALSRALSDYRGELRVLTGQTASTTALLLGNGSDLRQAQAALLVLINLDASGRREVPACILSEAAEFAPFARVDGDPGPLAPLEPGEVRLMVGRRQAPVRRGDRNSASTANDASQGARLVIEAVTPHVSGGDFAVKRIVGDTIRVEADVFADGHEQLAVEVRWRALDGAWVAAPMTPTTNDRWSGAFTLDRLGAHEFVVEAWIDVFGGFSRDLRKKRDAGVATPVDAQEGRLLVEKAKARTKGPLRKFLGDQLTRIDAAADEQKLELLLQPRLAELMQQADDRPFRLQSSVQRVDAERSGAGFASWYELFPRSQTDDPARHGTFDDVIARLPAVRAMGFDVLYFPPIHPIGAKNRKGRNNSLTPAADDPGSPYAIGSEAGGHDAIHPELGTLDDFRRLFAAAAQQGLELALDFAVQCSPDHPWLKEHPGWFDHRPDGTIKYAENPPKRYEDIVNVDFYKPEATPALWLALRDIVLFWAKEGVRLFRVDNPHTKPLPFWEWMIADVRAIHPDVVFLAEAFTRPKVMYRLAKIGFSQSYTYFTWRHSKSELTDYMVELTTTAPKDFFRPHFFVNTPDINPYFLQHSGRGGFLIRAALAATLSGLWGVYSGFEVLESEPVPGKEEYQDSEKYQIRVRDWSAPNIIPEITRLNMIRKGHPALHSHLGVTFLPAFNDNVLFFEKASPAGDDVLLIAISLDPHNAQEADLELPLRRWGLSDDAAVEIDDLVFETRFTLHGKHQHLRLDPDHPYAIWSILTPRSPAP